MIVATTLLGTIGLAATGLAATGLASEGIESAEPAVPPWLIGVSVFAFLVLLLVITTRFNRDR
ncbi:hypothetical protein BH24ACT13_BH24ACT13_01220 [soil metagenome]